MDLIDPLPRGLNEPRYKASPISLFFEDLIIDVIGHLDPSDAERLEAMNLRKVFSTEATEWRAVIREVLNLSETFDIAARDLWYRNREHHRLDGFELHPLAFAQDFVDHYLADDSKIDVFTPQTLEEARTRVRGHEQAKERS
ncbi:MAG: hypothetical protein ABIQ65_01530 [Thermoanaerobaculia bacterium]